MVQHGDPLGGDYDAAVQHDVDDAAAALAGLGTADVDGKTNEEADGGVDAAGTQAETEDNDPDFITLRVPIRNYSRESRNHKIVTPDFEFAGYRWNLLVFPNGNDNRGQFLSVFVNCVNGTRVGIFCTFAIKVINALDHNQSKLKDHQHRFSVGENADRGFDSIIPCQLLRRQGAGWLVDDTLQLEVHLRRITLSGRQNVNWNSKTETGFVGLQNQGATCYMNSLLQSLYHLPAFRSTVYNIEMQSTQQQGKGAAATATSSNSNKKHNMPLALARLFRDLQFNTQSVGTQKLTKSFGWDSHDSFMQHDVQEFFVILTDTIDQKLKNTVMSDRVQKLFTGKIQSYLECINVDYASTKTEAIHDVQLTVNNIAAPTLAAAFDAYVATETMDGDNKYRTDGFGYQAAKKGIRFLSFPPVLNLQLKRFDYDYIADRNVKLNDRFEFPTELDLSPWLTPPSNKPPDAGAADIVTADVDDAPIYYLHSVLVHSGGVHGGHYYVHIRPTPTSDAEAAAGGPGAAWFKFDDDFVTKISRKTAVDGTFGGREEYLKHFKTASAYMLVYVHRRHAQLRRFTAESTLSGRDIYATCEDIAAQNAQMFQTMKTQREQKEGDVDEEEEEESKLDDGKSGKGDGGGGDDSDSDNEGAVKKDAVADAYDSARMRKYDKYACQPDVELPQTMCRIFEQEARDYKARVEEQRSAHLYRDLHLLDFRKLCCDGAELSSPVDAGHTTWSAEAEKQRRRPCRWDVAPSISNVTWKMTKTDTLSLLRRRIAKEMGIPAERQQLFVYYRRQNDTRRPNQFVFASHRNMQRRLADEGVASDNDTHVTTAHPSLPGSLNPRIFDLDSSPVSLMVFDADPDFFDVHGAGLNLGTKGSVLLLLKYFDNTTQTLHFVGYGVFPVTQTVADVRAYFLALPGVAKAVGANGSDINDVRMWEEENARVASGPRIHALAPEATLSSCKLWSGDIFVFQRASTPSQDQQARVSYFRHVLQEKRASDAAEPVKPVPVAGQVLDDVAFSEFETTHSQWKRAVRQLPGRHLVLDPSKLAEAGDEDTLAAIEAVDAGDTEALHALMSAAGVMWGSDFAEFVIFDRGALLCYCHPLPTPEHEDRPAVVALGVADDDDASGGASSSSGDADDSDMTPFHPSQQRVHPLPLQCSYTYDQVVRRLSARLHVTPDRIRLTKFAAPDPVKMASSGLDAVPPPLLSNVQTVAHFDLQRQYDALPSTATPEQRSALRAQLDRIRVTEMCALKSAIYYEVLPYSRTRLVTHTPVIVSFVDTRREQAEVAMTVMVETATATVADVIAAVERRLSSSVRARAVTHGDGPLRLVQHDDHKYRLVHNNATRWRDVASTDRGERRYKGQYKRLRVEYTPAAEVALAQAAAAAPDGAAAKKQGGNGRVLWLFHYHANNFLYVKPHGQPFSVVVYPGDTIGDVRARIQTAHGVPDAKFERWSFAVMQPGQHHAVAVADTVDMTAYDWSKTALCVEHPPVRRRKQQAGAYAHREQAIKIRT